MEFPFYVSKVLQLDQEGYCILDAASLNTSSSSRNTQSYGRGQSQQQNDPGNKALAQIIDEMGDASSIAQGLKQVITTYGKFIASGDNRLYIKAENNKVCGILKVGKRNLFHHDGIGKMKELRPLCVLDFYVHESYQRKGLGKIMFEKMLQTEGVEPQKLAYDKPSPKLIGFLRKHYNLSSYVPQNNNYVIFNQYWEDKAPSTNNQLNQQRNAPYTLNQNITDYSNNPNSYSSRRPPSNSFNKVGQSVLQNTISSFPPSYQESVEKPTRNTFQYTKNNQNGQPYTSNTTSLPNTMNYYSNSNNYSNKFESQKNLNPTANYTPMDMGVNKTNITLQNSISTLDSRIKSTEDQILMYQKRVDNMKSEQNKFQSYNAPLDQGYKGYSTRTPWANFANPNQFTQDTSQYKQNFSQANLDYLMKKRTHYY